MILDDPIVQQVIGGITVALITAGIIGWFSRRRMSRQTEEKIASRTERQSKAIIYIAQQICRLHKGDDMRLEEVVRSLLKDIDGKY